MDGNLTQQLSIDNQQIQKLINQFMGEAVKSVPEPKMPSWTEVVLSFADAHPWFAFFILFGVLVVIFAVIRELICSYFKTNEILARLKRLEEKMP